MNVALIFPPTCDPTAPYLAVPMLTAVLRRQGVEVFPIDANVEVYHRLLQPSVLNEMGSKIVKRLSRLGRKKGLNHSDQLRYGQLWEALPDLAWVPAAIEDAVSVLKDRSGVRFYDPARYEEAIQTIQAGLRIISAAYTPLMLDFTTYRTPFALLTMDHIRSDGQPERNPFQHYFAGELSDLLRCQSIDLVGISLAFPGQLQPGYALAATLRQTLPRAHITVGGPAITQMLVRLPAERLAEALGPFHSAVLFEGEQGLLELIRMLASGQSPTGVLYGERCAELGELPPPDFEGLPLGKYLSPELVLPYDPTRGCYWRKCTFCHYGLSPKGPAAYRERPIDQVAAHLRYFNNRWGCSIVYFSQDAFAPKAARELARKLQASNSSLRWATDMRPEPELTLACCRDLREGGALSMALGIESASPRLLRRIHKGVAPQDIQTVIKNLCHAGVAVEAMCFTEFPTETYPEANATIAFIREMREQIALFICGRFGLCHGSRVAHHPEKFGIKKIWHVIGDELQTGLFYEERFVPKTAAEKEKLEQALDELSKNWWLHDYPWAGALSTAHTLLWYARYGSDVFRRFAGIRRHTARSKRSRPRSSRFDIQQMMKNASRHEAEIWHHLIYERKAVSPELYAQRSKTYPSELPRKSLKKAQVRPYAIKGGQ